MNLENKNMELTEKDIGRWVTYTNGEKGKIKTFNNDTQTAFVVYKCNNNWDLDHWKDYTAEATRYGDLSL